MFLFPLSFSRLKDEATFVAGGDGREEEEACATVVSSHGPRNRSAALSPRHTPAFQYRNRHQFVLTKLVACSCTLSSHRCTLGPDFSYFNFGEFRTESLVCRLLLRGGGEETSLFLSPPPCPPFFGTGRCSRCFSSFLSPHAHSRHSAPPFSSSWIHEKLAPSSPLSSDASSSSLHLLPSPSLPLHLIN